MFGFCFVLFNKCITLLKQTQETQPIAMVPTQKIDQTTRAGSCLQTKEFLLHKTDRYNLMEPVMDGDIRKHSRR